MIITDASSVTLHYTGTLSDGSVFDSSEGNEPLVVRMGTNMVIPGFEKALLGMKKGEKKTFTIPKEEAYPYHDELIQTIPRSSIPKELPLEEGTELVLKAPTGHRIPARVTKITEEDVTVDMNVPVAGKDLTFSIEIVDVL